MGVFSNLAKKSAQKRANQLDDREKKARSEKNFSLLYRAKEKDRDAELREIEENRLKKGYQTKIREDKDVI